VFEVEEAYERQMGRWSRQLAPLFPGIYFLGLRWLYKRKSFFMFKAGPAEDAAFIADVINNVPNPE